ncbi:hypothetical protein LEN26_020984 [Aphanomyces euteiches]|nr:hypothetical protein LEN26_020984 [Aphanomyces euteiches]
MSTLLHGKVIAITGKLSLGSRDDVAKLIQAHGGVMASSVTKGVTHLVTNDPSGTSSKLVQARKWCIEIVGEDFLTALAPANASAIEPPTKKLKQEVNPTIAIEGRVFTFIGDLDLDRQECIRYIESKGGSYVERLSDKVTDAVIKDARSSSPELTKAQSQGVNLVTEAAMTQLIFSDMFGEEEAAADNNAPMPNRVMTDGEAISVPGNSSNYEVRYRGGVYYCTCMGWKMQNKAVDARSCKHLKQILGEPFELWRTTGSTNPGAASIATSSTMAKQTAPKLLLAQKWEAQDVVGWWISEKFDGVRGYWNGTTFLSRLGNPFYAPHFFTQGLPTDHHLDGELFLGRGRFEQAVSIVKSQNLDDKWKTLKFMVFDVPTLPGDFETRMEYLQTKIAPTCPYAVIVEHKMCTSEAMLLDTLKAVEAEGAEGLMLRQPKSFYVKARSSTLLKVKTFSDDEAIVTGYEKGKGKYAGMTGSLKVRNRDGKTFAVGSGLTDALRTNPPPVGTIITYRFQEKTQAGIPRFPTFVGIAIDKAWDEKTAA